MRSVQKQVPATVEQGGVVSHREQMNVLNMQRIMGGSRGKILGEDGKWTLKYRKWISMRSKWNWPSEGEESVVYVQEKLRKSVSEKGTKQRMMMVEWCLVG